MAEFIFKYMVETRGMAGKYTVDSAATSTEEIWGGVGNPIYPPARVELHRNGIPFEERCAVLIRRDDYSRYDLFIAMDDRNVKDLLRIFGSDPKGKIHKLMEYTGRSSDVSDPWYTRRFSEAYRDIWEGCLSLLNFLETDK